MNASPRHAMVVEDDDAIALIIETILRSQNWAIDRHEGAETALTADVPDLLITDLTLPGACDGLAVSRALRARAPEIAVVYISGSIDAETRLPGGVEGATCLGKPFRRAALMTAIEEALSAVPRKG